MKRFWDKVNKNAPNGCWHWCASTRSEGRYGVFHFNGHNQGAHRVAWQLTHGAIPKGLHVLHKCDNGICVRPDHLFLGSHQVNMEDRNVKGRAGGGSLSGNQHPRARLSSEDVQNIRFLYNNDYTKAELSRLYNVNDMIIHKIITRQTWKDI